MHAKKNTYKNPLFLFNDENLDVLNLLNRIKVDENELSKSKERMEDVWNYREPDTIPIVIDVPVPRDWPTYNYYEEFHDMRKMLVNQLSSVYVHSLIKDDSMLTIRANYGVSIIPSAFGCKIIVKGNNMPWAESIIREIDDVYTLEVPDLTNEGLCSRVIETIEFYKDQLSKYGLDNYVHIYLADTQGPLDLAFLLRGHLLYRDMFMNRKAVHRLLDICTEAYIEFSKIQKEVIGEPYDQAYHAGIFMVRGGVRICEDVAVNISPHMYLEFSKPYNEMAFKPFNGGYIHFCGRGHHILKHTIDTEGVRGINLGDPDMYNLKELMEELSKRRICLIYWPLKIDINKGFRRCTSEFLRRLNMRTGIIVKTNAPSIDMAKKILRKWRELFK